MINILLLFLCSFCFAEDTLPPPQPLMKLSQNMPLQMDEKNINMLREEIEQESKKNLELAKAREIPQNALLVLLASFFIFLMVKMPKKPVSLEKTPEEIALESKIEARTALKRLQNEYPSEGGKESLFFFQLSTALRKYIQGQHRISALTLTTEELKQYNLNEYLPLLELSDTVIFSGYTPSTKECQKALSDSFSLIETP